MNQPGVVKIHSWFTPQTADCKLWKCRAHPVVERPRSLQPPFNDDAVTPPNFQFQFAITFRPCYFTPRADSAIMFHHIDCKIINRETCHLFFAEKLNHFSLT